MIGVDKVLAAKEERTKLRKEKKLSGANVWKNRVHLCMKVRGLQMRKKI